MSIRILQAISRTLLSLSERSGDTVPVYVRDPREHPGAERRDALAGRGAKLQGTLSLEAGDVAISLFQTGHF
jgi:hypothetical protein